MAGLQPSGSYRRKASVNNKKTQASASAAAQALQKIHQLQAPSPHRNGEGLVNNTAEDPGLTAFKRRKRRNELLKRSAFPLACLLTLGVSALGYWANVSDGNFSNNAGFWHRFEISKPDSEKFGSNINPIIRPADELTANAENAEAYSLLGLQNPDMASSVSAEMMTMEDPMAADETSPMTLASGRQDPFEPILLQNDSQSPLDAGEEAQESLQIQFSGVVDDPVSKRKVAILKILNPDHLMNSNVPEYLTIVKKINEKFAVSDKSLVIKSISNQTVTVAIDGKAIDIPLNTFNAAASEDGVKPVSLSGANAINTQAGSGNAPPAPIEQNGSASITPAANNNNGVLRVQE